MRYGLLVLLLVLNCTVFAQKRRASLAKTVTTFDRALVDKDSAKLSETLYDSVAYGHSNGWVQTKQEVIGDLYNGKLTYKQIKEEDQHIIVERRTAAVRSIMNVDVEMQGKLMSFKLKVLQVWVWKNKRWQLFARQSVRI